MKRIFIKLCINFCALFLFFFSDIENHLFAQKEEVNLNKVLNPLPSFNPFESISSPPQYFPDVVDRRVQKALIDTLTNNHQTLKDHIRFFKKGGEAISGKTNRSVELTDQVVDLYHGTIVDRQDYLKAQVKALESTNSEQHKNLIRSRIQNDELNKADKLLRNYLTNRWGAVVNRLLSSVDMLSLLSGSYLGAAIDAALPQYLSVGNTSMSIAERKALVLYIKFLKRYPNDPRQKEIRKVINTLAAKKKEILVAKYLDEGDKALGNREYGIADLSYEIATFIDPDSERTRIKIKMLKEQTRKKGRNLEKRGSYLNSESETEPLEILALLTALSLRDTKQIEVQAALIQKNHPASALGESSREALSVALDIQGRHGEAKTILEKIARSSVSPSEVKRAKDLLASPEYNLLKSLRQGQTHHRIETIKYILLGEDLLQKNILLGAGPVITQGLAGVQTFGVSNLLIIGTNLFEVLTRNPISYQSVIEKGIAQIRKHPNSENSTDVYTLLGDTYEQIGRYDKAIAYHQISGNASEEKIAKLQMKAAELLLKGADKSKDRTTRKIYLQAILRYYPNTDAAKESIGKLARLEKLENKGLKITKKFLMDNPGLYGSKGLGLKASLFDDDLNNMELADNGLNLLTVNSLLFHFKTPWGIQSRIYPVESKRVARLKVSLRKKHYEIAMGDIHSRGQGSTGGLRDLPPQLLQGNSTRKMANLKTTDLTLVKKAVGSSRDHTKILDHQLISENEKNPNSKFKLPPIKGSISTSQFDISGRLPTALWGDQISLGSDGKSPFAGLRLPIPMLKNFIPIDFLLQGRPGRPSLTPQIHRFNDSEIEDTHLYR